ncbi:TetR/AcrR family transcriptional regulator [Corynebacterium nuruki]|nr:TetR/AcrR family transcriptional regulator [Corynebacterium nuruki]
MGGPVNGVAQPTECVPDPSAEVAVTQPIRVTGPGRKPKFREEDVLREAMAMGLDCFTLTGIAERLGVVTSALYRLFPNRDMVVERCLQQVIAECRTPSPDMTWQDTLRLWGSEIWRLIGTFDGLAVIIMKYEYSGWLISNLWTAYTESLLASGRTRGQVIFALRIIADIDIGAGLRTEGAPSPELVGDPGDWRWQERHRSGIPVEDLWTTTPSVQSKIEIVIEGLERHWPEANDMAEHAG